MANTPRPNPLLGALAMGATATETAKQKNLMEQKMKSEIMSAGLSAIGEAGMRASLVPFNVAQARRMEGIQRLEDEQREINIPALQSKAESDKARYDFGSDVLNEYRQRGGVHTDAEAKLAETVFKTLSHEQKGDVIRAQNELGYVKKTAEVSVDDLDSKLIEHDIKRIKDTLKKESLESTESYKIPDQTSPTGFYQIPDPENVGKMIDADFTETGWYQHMTRADSVANLRQKQLIGQDILGRVDAQEQRTQQEKELFGFKINEASQRLNLNAQQMQKFSLDIEAARSKNNAIIRGNNMLMRAMVVNDDGSIEVNTDLFNAGRSLLMKHDPTTSSSQKIVDDAMQTILKSDDPAEIKKAKDVIDKYRNLNQKKNTIMEDRLNMMDPTLDEGLPEYARKVRQDIREYVNGLDIEDKVAWFTGTATKQPIVSQQSDHFSANNAMYTTVRGADRVDREVSKPLFHMDPSEIADYDFKHDDGIKYIPPVILQGRFDNIEGFRSAMKMHMSREAFMQEVESKYYKNPSVPHTINDVEYVAGHSWSDPTYGLGSMMAAQSMQEVILQGRGKYAVANVDKIMKLHKENPEEGRDRVKKLLGMSLIEDIEKDDVLNTNKNANMYNNSMLADVAGKALVAQYMSLYDGNLDEMKTAFAKDVIDIEVDNPEDLIKIFNDASSKGVGRNKLLDGYIKYVTDGVNKGMREERLIKGEDTATPAAVNQPTAESKPKENFKSSRYRESVDRILEVEEPLIPDEFGELIDSLLGEVNYINKARRIHEMRRPNEEFTVDKEDADTDATSAKLLELLPVLVEKGVSREEIKKQAYAYIAKHKRIGRNKVMPSRVVEDTESMIDRILEEYFKE